MQVRWSTGWIALLIAVIVGGGCASTDLGAPCHLLRPDNTEASPVPGQDIVQTGSGECQQFVCASFNGSSPQCSQPCEAVGDPCPGGLVCRTAVLNSTLLQMAQSRTQGQDANKNGVDDFQDLLGSVTTSLYCGPKN